MKKIKSIKRFKLILIFITIIFLFSLTSCNHMHRFKYVKTIEESTCSKEGSKEYKCKSCGEVRIEVIARKDHKYVDGFCSECNIIKEEKLMVYWRNLEYTLSDDGTYYIITRMLNIPSNKPIGRVVIPEVYNGLPIKKIDSKIFKGLNQTFDIEVPKCLERIDLEYDFSGGGLYGIYYRGTLEDWCKLRFNDYNDNYMKKARNFYLLDDESKFYLLDNIVIPNNITSIGSYQFCLSRDIRYVEIPNTVVEINQKSFFCYYDKLYYRGTLSDWCNVSLSSLGANIIAHAEEVYMLDNNNEYYKIDKLMIPDGVKTINENQFACFHKVTEITIPNSVEKIKSYVFMSCKNINKIVIPSSVTEMGEGVFISCNNLKEVIFEENCQVSTIRSRFFKDCSSLSKLVLSKNIVKFEADVFDYHPDFDSVYYNGTIEDWCKIEFVNESSNPLKYAKHFYVKDDNNEYYEVTNLVIPSTVNSIGNYQFYGYKGLITTTISSSVEYIGINAFYGCKNLKEVIFEENSSLTRIEKETFKYCESLEKINIPNSVKSIGEEAFYDCEKLNTLILPATLEKIELFAFFYALCVSTASVYFEGTIEDWCKIEFDSEESNPMSQIKHFYMLDKKGEFYEPTEFIIPETVTHIKSYAFIYLSNIKKVYIPKSVTTIEALAIYRLSRATIYCGAPSKPEEWHSQWVREVDKIYWNRSRWY